MRLIRLVIFIIVFVAAMSLGVASAAAESTALCNTDEGSGAHELCKFGHEISHVHTATLSGQKARLLTALQNNRIYHVHYATLSGAKAKILTSFLTVECDVSFLGNAFEAEGSVIGHLTYTNCGSCSVSETSKEAIIELEKLSHEFADLTFEFEIHAV